jgi:hypothetical protein
VFTNTIQDYCGMSALDSCSAAVTSVAWDPGKKIVFHAIAAFPPESSPRLKALSFGIDFDSTKFVMAARGTCADFEIPGNRWPALGTGTSQSWTTGTQTGLLTEIYWFAGYVYSEEDAEDSTSVALIPHPQQHGVFVDDAFPSEVDTIAAYGRLGFGMSGHSACPLSPGGDDTGSGDSSEIEGFGDPTDFDSTSLIVHIDPTRLLLPERSTSVSLAELGALPGAHVDDALLTTLQAAGVTSLRKLVPGFDPVIVDRERQPVLGPDGRPLTVPHDLSRWFVLALDRPDARSACARLRATSLFTHVGLNGIYRLCAAPNDPMFTPQQWGLYNVGQYCGTAGFDINALAAWDNYGTGTSWPSQVGILDTGLSALPNGRPGHVDIYDASAGYNTFIPSAPPIDYSPDSHGTACAGLVAMKGNNEQGGAAPGWGVTVVPVKACDDDGCPQENVIAGLEWLRGQGVKIVNMSFAGEGPSEAEMLALQNGRAAGMAFVASAGNINYSVPIHYPAMYRRSVIAVNAFMNDGNVWDDDSLCCWPHYGWTGASQCADWVDVTAPGGRGIMTTKSPASGESYYDLSDLDPDPPAPCQVDWLGCTTGFTGTSAAAAVVSGVLGAILATNNELDGADAEQVMMRTLTDHTQYGLGYDIQSGWGRPNLEAALAHVAPPRQVENGIVTGTGPTPCGSGTLNLEVFPGLADGAYYFDRYVWEATVGLVHQYTTPPEAWGRALGSTGFRWIGNYETVHYWHEEPGYTDVMHVTSTTISLRTFSYHLRSSSGVWSWFPTAPPPHLSYTAVEGGAGSGVEDGRAFAKLRVAPNPAESSVRVYLGLAKTSAAVEVFDAGGRRVTTLDLDQRGSGKWDLRDAGGRRVAGGVYFLRCRGAGESGRARLLVVR